MEQGLPLAVSGCVSPLSPQFFQVEACGGAGTPLPPAALAAALGGLRARTGRGGAPPLGLLTGQHRHAWGRVYRLLMRGELAGPGGVGLPVLGCLWGLGLPLHVLTEGGTSWFRAPGGGSSPVGRSWGRDFRVWVVLGEGTSAAMCRLMVWGWRFLSWRGASWFWAPGGGISPLGRPWGRGFLFGGFLRAGLPRADGVAPTEAPPPQTV